MDNDLKVIKRRIKKLFALSKSPNESEAVAALKKAQELMQEYHLSEHDCLYEKQIVKATKRISHWRGIIAYDLAWLHYCYSYRDSSAGTIIFYGDSLDVFMASEMYRYLTKTIERMVKQNTRKSTKRKWREQYKQGIAFGLSVRIKELGVMASWAPERENKILAAKKSIENEIELVCEKTKLKFASGTSAFKQGVDAANDISLNRQTTGHGGRYIGA